jgi:membrane protein DedA with SNARE-associated domain
MAERAEWLLFIGVLANQAGVPIPAAPWLLAAGVLAASGHVSLIAVVAVAAGAALGADLAWYALGRWRGEEALTKLLRFLRQPPATVDRVMGVFRAHRLGFVWSARFLPELNPIAAGLAGVTGVKLPRFLLYASGSALAWAGVWSGGGFLLVGTITASADPLGVSAAGLMALALTAVVAGVVALAEWRRRRRSRREIDTRMEQDVWLERLQQLRRGHHLDGSEVRSADPSATLVRDRPNERATAA